MGSMVSVLQKTGRTARNPVHPWHVRSRPFELQPICIAPVLPGETMTSLLWQCRAQTEQLRAPLIGWHAEFYWFYVKLSQLDTPENWIAPGTGMLMNPEFDPTSLADPGQAVTYHEDTSSIDYVARCKAIVVREYFRDEGIEDETTAIGIVNGRHVVHVNRPGWMDSIALTSALVAASPDLPDDAANATMRQLEQLARQWEMLNVMGVTEMTYEDFLATFGIGSPNLNAKKPEILRWAKYWQLPATAVDGATGTTSSVVSWKLEGRADKDRLFREHGFICGFVTYRPKTYSNLQGTAAVSALNSAFAWAPRMFDTQFAGVTVKDQVDGTGPLTAVATEGYTFDTKDLFLYGDQFTNVYDATDVNSIGFGGVPTGRYPTATEIDALFVAANTTNLVYNDGVVRIGVKSALRDTTPMNRGRVIMPLNG